MPHVERVNIRPGVTILSVLRHLNYKPWFALAEFVDNSLQSYHSQIAKGEASAEEPLNVRISVSDAHGGEISISDDAGGIAAQDFERAFRAAAIPPDRAGLSEFGMGMKSAACWFAPRWEVRTSVRGEPIVRTIRFDILRIVDGEINELEVREEPESADAHYTVVRLIEPYKLPVGRTLAKIEVHLTDIYRDFVRRGKLRLTLNGRPLEYSPPPILQARYFKNPDGPSVLWRKDIDFSLGGGLSVRGFAALRETASTSRAGFALFRRGRLIQGSADEGYRPEYVFGRSNSYTYQRLFGELHLEGFEVSHTKDGIRWDENEQPFLELLKEHLDSDELPLLRQAEGYRVRQRQLDAVTAAASQAVDATADALQSGLPAAINGIPGEPASGELPPNLQPTSRPQLASRDIEVTFRGQRWIIHLEVSSDPAVEPWLSISDGPSRPQSSQARTLGVRVSLSHPFMIAFMGANAEQLEGLFRVAAALALAEVLAREAGVRFAGTVIRNVNSLLREALSRP
jgi:hypothetical protein